MKGSLIIVAFFVAGVILARWDVLPQELLQQDFSMYVLYGLMFLVGISIGSDRKAWAALKGQQLRIVLVPLATIVGTLAGSIGVSFLLTDIRLTDCLAIGSGFGYYSLSSIFITEYRGAELICSFRTLISPSSFPLSMPVSFSWERACSMRLSSSSISVWI